MSNNQQQLIKKYFNSLVDQFITDPKHKNIDIVFTGYLDRSLHGDTLGNTHREHTWTRQETAPSSGIYKKVPGSDVYKYTISFLNNYKDTDQLRGTVVHELSHLYLFSKSDNSHDHDDIFYSKMDQFEGWLDKYYGLSPRKDKDGDWNQHIDPSKREERQKKNCTDCGKREIPYTTSGKCFQCCQKNEDEVREHNERCRESDEFNRLADLLKNSQSLNELERNYQTVKNSPLYSSNRKTVFANSPPDQKDNKAFLDEFYTNRKSHFQPNSDNNNNDKNPSNLDDLEICHCPETNNHKPNCVAKCNKCNHSASYEKSLDKYDNSKCFNLHCENYLILKENKSKLKFCFICRHDTKQYWSTTSDITEMYNCWECDKKHDRIFKNEVKVNCDACNESIKEFGETGGRTFDLVEELIDTEFVKTIHQFAESKGGNKKTGLFYACHSCKEVLWPKVSGSIGEDYKKRLKELTERGSFNKSSNPQGTINWKPWIIGGSIVGVLFVIYLLGKIISSARPVRRRRTISKK